MAFLEVAIAWYHGLDIRVQRVMSDNGSCYRSRAFSKACAALGFKHTRIRPKPTARPNASSGPGCANGSTGAPIKRQTSAKMN